METAGGSLVLAAPFDVDFGTGFVPLADGIVVDPERAHVRSDMWVWDTTRHGARLLAVGGLAPDPDTGAQEGAVWSSADGLTWDKVPMPRTVRERAIRHVAASDGVIVATDGRDLLVGTDAGTRWDRIQLDGAEVRIADLASTPARLVVVGDDSQGAVSWTSADGRAWERSRILDPALELRSVEAAGSMLVAHGTSEHGDASWWISDDAGLTWNRETDRAAPEPADAKLTGTTSGVLAVSVGTQQPAVVTIMRVERPGAWQALAVAEADAPVPGVATWSSVLSGERLTIALRTLPGVVPEWLGLCRGGLGPVP